MAESFSFSDFPFPDITPTEDVLPRVPLDEVLELQSVAMRSIMPMSRSRRSRRTPRVMGFALLHETNTNVTPDNVIQAANDYGEYDHEIDVDTYLGVLVRKPTPWQWCFSISFLQNIMTEEEKLSFTRDIFRFEWSRGDSEVLGTRRIIRSFGRALTTEIVDTDSAISFERTEQRSRETQITPVSFMDCQELRTRVQTHAMYCRSQKNVA
ncbi:hypothetical protein EYC59_02520 [Candidatus Saccharibacteria bacterium]|nr:MAG: hypothetical protein EYC59_02520 [Candidatus Saccharibacteria bacterium]